MDKQTLARAAIRDAGAARFPGVEGRIPNFVGAEAPPTGWQQQPAWDELTGPIVPSRFGSTDPRIGGVASAVPASLWQLEREGKAR